MRLLCVACSRELRLLNSSNAAAISLMQCQIDVMLAMSRGVTDVNRFG